MDTSLFPLIQQLYNKWIVIKQDGELLISTTTLKWTSSDQTTTLNLIPSLEQQVTTLDLISSPEQQVTSLNLSLERQVMFTKLLTQTRLKDPIQWLKAYYDLGKFIEGETLLDPQEYPIKPFTLKAAR